MGLAVISLTAKLNPSDTTDTLAQLSPFACVAAYNAVARWDQRDRIRPVGASARVKLQHSAGISLTLPG